VMPSGPLALQQRMAGVNRLGRPCVFTALCLHISQSLRVRAINVFDLAENPDTNTRSPFTQVHRPSIKGRL